LFRLRLAEQANISAPAIKNDCLSTVHLLHFRPRQEDVKVTGTDDFAGIFSGKIVELA
jgi:hypothetical protein